MVQRVSIVVFEGIEARGPWTSRYRWHRVCPPLPLSACPTRQSPRPRRRVRSALIASGLALPARRITINLAPTDLPKEGSHYDLPIALGLMAAIGANARGEGLICSKPCGPEAAWASPEIEIIAARSLIQLANHFKGTQVLTRPQPKIRELAESTLAARLPSILPPLAPAELLEMSMIASVAGEIEGGALTNKRPFRAPHHSASMPALVGGGLRARPGEISLAHIGVLFLDEMPEFAGQALDSLRKPLETGEVAVARVNHRITYPARFMLVAAMNPCRCGRASDPGFVCKRGTNVRCAAEYQGGACPARCLIVSTCTSKCPPSPPPTSFCRRPRKAAAKLPPASRARATSRPNAMPRWA